MTSEVNPFLKVKIKHQAGYMTTADQSVNRLEVDLNPSKASYY